MRVLLVLLISLFLILSLTSCLFYVNDSQTTVLICEELVNTELDEITDNTDIERREYVLNTHSDKFHYPSCESARRISTKNRAEYFGTREELIEDGYSPCGNCDP